MAPIQFLINLIGLSLAGFFIYWSKTGNLKQLITATFQHRKLANSQSQADHLSDIAYYYALYTITLSSLVTIIRFLKGQFNQAVKSDAQFVTSLNRIISNSTEHFFIFMSIYVYLLQQKGFGLKNDHVLLMPLWFLIARLVSLVESMLNFVFKGRFRFGYLGSTLTMAPYFVMIGNIFGYSPLSWF